MRNPLYLAKSIHGDRGWGSLLVFRLLRQDLCHASNNGRFRLHVAWPSGEHTWIDSIRAGRRYEVVEPDPSTGATAEKSPKKIPANPVFRSSPSMGDTLQHVETATDEVMQWQPLLLDSLGVLEPSLQVSDFNRDGVDGPRGGARRR